MCLQCPRDQKKVSDVPDLDIQMVVSQYWELGTEHRFSATAAGAPNH